MEKKSQKFHPNVRKILSIFTRREIEEFTQEVQKLSTANAQFCFDSDAQVWPQTTAQILATLAEKFSQKLAKIKRIGNIPSVEALVDNEEISLQDENVSASIIGIKPSLNDVS